MRRIVWLCFIHISQGVGLKQPQAGGATEMVCPVVELECGRGLAGWKFHLAHGIRNEFGCRFLCHIDCAFLAHPQLRISTNPAAALTAITIATAMTWLTGFERSISCNSPDGSCAAAGAALASSDGAVMVRSAVVVSPSSAAALTVYEPGTGSP